MTKSSAPLAFAAGLSGAIVPLSLAEYEAIKATAVAAISALAIKRGAAPLPFPAWSLAECKKYESLLAALVTAVAAGTSFVGKTAYGPMYGPELKAA